MGKLKINDKEYEFKPNQTIIEVAAENGIDIPHFCWHPSLSVSGNCRMCLVEVEKMPKLVISCSTYATEGMVVNVNSQKSIDARKAVMEFILINHPLDCPICDEAGECKLQDYTYQHSVGESRFVEQKAHKEKRVKLGPRIIFDGERCISCSRCIRFSDEIAKKNQLTFVKRGDRVTINTFPGETFDNNYTLNTTDICPVGALTNADFRFKSRVWEMNNTDSVCVGCSRGCNTEIWVRDNKIQRLTPRQNNQVNDYWMCDNGRLETFKFVNDETRLDGCFVNTKGVLDPVNYEDAILVAISRLKDYKPEEIAFIGSAFSTIEEHYTMLKFAKNLGVANIFIPEHIVPGDCDDILLTEDKTPNSLGVKLLSGANGSKLNMESLVQLIENGKIKSVLMLDDKVDNTLAETTFKKLKSLIVIASNRSVFSDMATVVLSSSTYAEKNGTFVNGFGQLQRIRPAVATVEMDRALDGLSMSRWDKFGTPFDRWMQGKKYNSKPIWQIFVAMSNLTNNKFKFNMAEEVFSEVTKTVKYFEGLDYDLIGNKGVKIKNYEKITK